MRLTFSPDDPDVDAYRLLTALVVPRPIAWISTVSADGVGNLAPHSFFSVASASPPMVTFTSVGHKDTIRKVRQTGEFTISISTEPLMDQVNATSASFAAEVDEAAQVQVEMAPSSTVTPPRVAQSPASLECVVHQIHEVGDSVLVIGQVQAMTVEDSALVDGQPDHDQMKPVSRLGGELWGLPAPTVLMPRPS